ncbi:MAG TPA: hypothetical protein VK183_07045 [Flavobacterium sp.]|nr:hypothetical protein [Flavobacterium sp.]
MKVRNLFLLLFAMNCVAQTATFKPTINSIPSSPEMAQIERFDNIPVSYYTGTPDISIPLYVLKIGSVEVPLVLRYQSSGIKVTDEATWVGLGWTLEPEGSIMQEIRGKSDQEDNYTISPTLGGSAQEYNSFISHLGINYASSPQIGDCLKTPVRSDAFPVCTDSSDAISILNSLLEGKGQPDIYHYNLSGVSGQYFVHPENGSIFLMDKKEPYEIRSTSTGWEAVSPNGTVFTLNALEESHVDGGFEVSGRTYKVTKIQPSGLLGAALFSYQDELFSSFYHHAKVTYNALEHTNLMGSTSMAYAQSQTTGIKKRLSQIITPEVTIVFNVSGRSDFQQDTNNTVTKLESIDILSTITGKKIKSFRFTYQYFNPNGDYTLKRLKLTAVKEVGYDFDLQTEDLSKRAYTFQYNDEVSLPAKNSFSRDFWGYYNGVANASLLPDLDFFEYTQQIVDQNNEPIFSYNPSFKADRYPNNNFAKAGMLKKVTYPTGGYTEYYFEPHTYENQFIPNRTQLDAMARSVTCNKGPYYQNSSDWVEQLVIQTPTTLFLDIDFNHGSPVLAQGGYNTFIIDALYSQCYVKITKTTGSGTVDLKVWAPTDLESDGSAFSNTEFTSGGGRHIDAEYKLVPETGAFYHIVASAPYVSSSAAYQSPLPAVGSHVALHYFDRSATDSISVNGGFRIKEIKSYSAPDQIALHKKYHYYGGKLLNRFEPIKVTEACYNQDLWFAFGVPYWNTTFAKRVDISTEYFGGGAGNPVGYDWVEEETVDDNTVTNIGKKKYSYYNVMNNGRVGMPTTVNFKNGLIKKEETYDKTSHKLEEKTRLYTNLPVYNPGVKGYTIENHQFGQFDMPISNSFINVAGVTPFLYKFTYTTYLLPVEWIMPQSVQTVNYHSNGQMSSVTSYQYNAKGQISSLTTTDSSGYELKTETSYASDEPYGDPIETSMVVKNMVDMPIKVVNKRNSEMVSLTKNEFAKTTPTSSLIAAKAVYWKKGGIATSAPPEKRLVYDSYDTAGNLTQYHQESGVNTSIVWGYNNTLPVAKIENMAYANIPSNLIAAIANATPSTMAGALATLRTDPSMADAMVTTFTYKPGIGVSTITDPRGYTAHFIYDNFGRLGKVVDDEGNIVSENEYHYKP